MERSQLPLPSLLGLFSALLMLSPELPLGIARTFEVPETDEGVQKVLTFALEQYNKDTGDSTNYFKMLRFRKALREIRDWKEHHLMVELVQTRCEKRAGMIMTYENFQKCPVLPENPKELICYFNVPDPKPLYYKMILPVTICRSSGPSQELLCSG